MSASDPHVAASGSSAAEPVRRAGISVGRIANRSRAEWHSVPGCLPPRPAGRNRRAVAAVEMAFVLPILVLLTFGAIEFGRAVMVCNVLTTAAREGARSGVLPNGTNTHVTTAVTDELTAHQLPTASATTTIRVNGVVADAATADTGNRISVSVTMPYSAVSWLPTPLRLGSHQLTGIAVMRRE